MINLPLRVWCHSCNTSHPYPPEIYCPLDDASCMEACRKIECVNAGKCQRHTAAGHDEGSKK